MADRSCLGGSCTYETKRVKPGLKAGAVESLHRRLDALEQHVRNRDQRDVEAQDDILPTKGPSSNTQETIALNIVSLLAKELPKLVDSSSQNHSSSDDHSSLPRKRRRTEDEDTGLSIKAPAISKVTELLGDKILELVITAYFSHVHHWIPMIHQERYRQRMDDPHERRKIAVLTHAITLAASKYVQDEQITSVVLDQSTRRDWIVYTAMNELSVESMQALIIVAYNDISSGNSEKAWSVVGSLTRTVEYLQLSIEQESMDSQPLCQPYRFLSSTRDWTELEERRRVFWNVFSLDRLCSVSMGWNTSLTSDDVHRRLPCDGIYWRKQDHVITPYFGIWDRSASRIGNPIIYMPSNQQASDQAWSPDARSQADSGSSSIGGQVAVMDMSTVGAYGYALEATESMSRVTSYFLQQKVDMRDRESVDLWLARFKELDLRLVYWKMLLPQKWKANMTRIHTPKMDPNLTLAHVTHNSSMIMLHQPIAYPSLFWAFSNKLPSACSAETCYSAGVEIAKITQNYLRFAVKTMPIPPQYCFCLYIAARMFLIHWRYYLERPLGDEFWFLLQSLEEVSRRWKGTFGRPEAQTVDLAAKYASKLQHIHQTCTADETYRINVVGYTDEVDHGCQTTTPDGDSNLVASQTSLDHIGSDINQWVTYASSITGPRQSSQINGDMPPPGIPAVHSPDTIGDNATLYANVSNGVIPTEPTGIPEMLLDQDFLNMDRVISYDDGAMFSANLDGGSW
ncbi:fungal-specific transcription factor domain-containing protein [Truncatella angustata]|uniref:Fungal-specific transcription factor domain-containing protein n=1 Tax=Truncatella angustata TaxID=152316 RepID=A0A9P8ZT12_9PEZI|nr:fungal-specific transcription factor domain-containing protein [Truncatella angustata]KAH6648321.1 fungal-specific transcription factor domain-containing protein [Truncatella angustata]